jgi:hypothetical protein
VLQVCFDLVITPFLLSDVGVIIVTPGYRHHAGFTLTNVNAIDYLWLYCGWDLNANDLYASHTSHVYATNCLVVIIDRFFFNTSSGWWTWAYGTSFCHDAYTSYDLMMKIR